MLKIDRIKNAPIIDSRSGGGSPISTNALSPTAYTKALGKPTPSTSQQRAAKLLQDDPEDNTMEHEGEEEEEWDDGKTHLAEEFKCMECICYLIFLIIFTGMAVFSIGASDLNYTQTQSIRNLLYTDEFKGWNGISEKSFNDISVIDDIYLYLKQILIPFLLTDSDIINNTEIYYVQRKHILLGGIRLRQIRLKPIECDDICVDKTLGGGFKCQMEINRFNDTFCYEPDAQDIDRGIVWFTNDTSYEYVDSADLLDQRYQGKFNAYPGGGYIQDLPLDMSDSIEIINILEDIEWIDAATSFVSVDFNMYNPSESLHTTGRLAWEMPTNGIFSNDEIKTWNLINITVK